MLEYYYKTIIRQDLLTKFSYTNVHEIPRLEQIVLTFTVSQTSLKSLLPSLSALFLISSIKPSFIVSKRPSLILKTKKGFPVGCQVRLRGKQKFLFLEKLIFSIFPRVKNLKWNYADNNVFISFENLFLFKEIEKEYDYFQDLSKLNINLVFKAKKKSEIIVFLSSLKFPFSSNKKL